MNPQLRSYRRSKQIPVAASHHRWQQLSVYGLSSMRFSLHMWPDSVACCQVTCIATEVCCNCKVILPGHIGHRPLRTRRARGGCSGSRRAPGAWTARAAASVAVDSSHRSFLLHLVIYLLMKISANDISYNLSNYPIQIYSLYLYLVYIFSYVPCGADRRSRSPPVSTWKKNRNMMWL